LSNQNTWVGQNIWQHLDNNICKFETFDEENEILYHVYTNSFHNLHKTHSSH
jgi:hypothetical protein